MSQVRTFIKVRISETLPRDDGNEWPLVDATTGKRVGMLARVARFQDEPITKQWIVRLPSGKSEPSITPHGALLNAGFVIRTEDVSK